MTVRLASAFAAKIRRGERTATSRWRQVPSRSSAANTSPATTEVSSGSAQRAGEAEHHQRPGPAGGVHPAAEQRVGGQRALLAHRGDEDRRRDPAGEDQQAYPPLREQLDQLEAVAAGHRDRRGGAGTRWAAVGDGRGHRPASCLLGEGEERGLERRDDGRELAHRDARAHEPRHQFVEGRHQRAHDEHVGVRPAPGVVDDARIPAVPAATSRAAAGSEVTQPVVEFAVLGGQLAHRAGEDDASGGEDGDLGAQRLEVVHPVAGQHDGGPVRGEPGEDAVHVLLAGRVQAVGRLVEHQQPRPGEQRGGQPEPLAHAEGEAADLVVGDVGEPDLRRARRRSPPSRASWPRSAASAARFCRAVSEG